MNELVLGLGGNVGSDDELLARFDDVASDFARRGRVRASRVYRAHALVEKDPPFLNAALAIVLDDKPEPDALLADIHAIEKRHGRRREVEAYWGPRTLDIDVLVWGRHTIRTPTLRVPHPRAHQRSFTLRPLIDLFGGEFVIPGQFEPLAALASAAAPPIEPTDYTIVAARDASTAG